MKRAKGKRFVEKPSQIKKTEKKIKKNQAKLQVEIQKTMQNRDKKFNKYQSSRKKSKAIYNIIITICLIVIAFSLYKIIDWVIENNKNKSILEDIQGVIHITHEEVTINNRPIEKASYSFTDLLQKNPQTIGWVRVPNSNIDYPVVQTTDNDFYLNHSFDKSANSAGWIFADYSCKIPGSQNTIIYGHNRKDRSMFGSLKNVLEDDWKADPNNQYITFADLNETGIYQIFSVFVCNDEDVNSYLSTDFKSDEDFKAYLKNLKNNSIQNYDTDIENSEKMITLYTCYGMNNQRLLVFAVKVY
ncbi:MAG: class B sortase [Clostridia bacterium]|nr:class B sortase [Clostridia bacterium]